MKQKVVIVGAGPAGLFAAYRLGKNYDVTIIDKGRSIDRRKCPNYSKKTQCVHCEPCNTIYGVGGAGLMSDGKLIFHTRTGNNLVELIGLDRAQWLVDEVEKILLPYNIRGEIGSVQRKSRLSTIAAKAGIEYIPAKEAHIGSDKLPALMKRIVADIQKNATIVTEQEVTGFDDGIIAGDNVYKADHYILATGRAGSGTLEKIIEQLNLTHSYNPVDIGVRVEVPKEIMEEVCAVSWDFKARMRTSTYEDEVRTFCVCPQGFVSREDHNGFCMVNGHSLSKQGAQSDNTNFAFLVTYRLTEPLKDGDLFGKEIARKATFIGDGKPILQRLGDLRRGRRSTWERINKFHRPVPTLRDVNPGDIGSAMEYRFVLDVIEGLEKLDEMVKGVANDSTLLYCPEIKFHGKRFTTDEYLETNKKGVYVAGDGSGWSRGIVGAACCGLLAAEGIMRKQ